MDIILNDILSFDYKLIFELMLESVTFEVFIKFLIVYFFVVWISIVVWVIKDINNRTKSIFLQVFSILIILLLTPFSIFIYLLIRPSKTLFEKYYEEVEYNLDTVSSVVEDRTKRIEESSSCFKCNKPIALDFKFCPNCEICLKEECNSCNKLIYAGWEICPYCWKKNYKKVKIIDNNIKKDKIINEKLIVENYLKKWENEDKVEKKVRK